MLQVSYIRDNREQVLERLAVKNFKQPELVDEIIGLDSTFRTLNKQLQEIETQLNILSKTIGEFKKARMEPNHELLIDNADLKTKERFLNEKLDLINTQREEKLLLLPNLPHSSVPIGVTASDNEEIYNGGEMPLLYPNAKPHWELVKKYDIIDFDLGVKITGAGFPVYKGKGAKLQRALISFFLDEAEKAGYKEMMLPLMVNYASGYGTGQLPDKEGQMYYVKQDELYLIPTAEVPITNLYRDVFLKGTDLPVKNCGYTPCFRREAGSYGSDVRGLNRLHQFDKVEIVQIVEPEKSYDTHKQMCGHIQTLLEKLELPFRILRLCGGDMSFASALTHDFETWSAAQKKWLEVSSVSNFETFQTARLNLRFKNEKGKNEYAHTLNGSALALPRIVATLLENNQTEKGIKIPEALVPYTKFEWID